MKIEFICNGQRLDPPPNMLIRIEFEEERTFGQGEVMEITMEPPGDDNAA